MQSISSIQGSLSSELNVLLQQQALLQQASVEGGSEVSSAEAILEEVTETISDLLNKLEEAETSNGEIGDLLAGDLLQDAADQLQGLLDQLNSLTSQINGQLGDVSGMYANPETSELLNSISMSIAEAVEDLNNSGLLEQNEAIVDGAETMLKSSMLQSVSLNSENLDQVQLQRSTSNLSFTVYGNVGNQSINSLLAYLGEKAPAEGTIDIMLIVMAVFIGASNIKAASMANISSLMNNNIQDVNTLNTAVGGFQAIENLLPYEYNGTDDLINPGTKTPYKITSYEDLFMIANLPPGSAGYDAKVANAFGPLSTFFLKNNTDMIIDPESGSPISVGDLFNKFLATTADGAAGQASKHNTATADASALFDFMISRVNRALGHVQSTEVNITTETDPNPYGTTGAATVHVLDQSSIRDAISAMDKGASLGNTTSNNLTLRLQAAQQMYTQSLDAAKSAVTTLQTVISSIWR